MQLTVISTVNYNCGSFPKADALDLFSRTSTEGKFSVPRTVHRLTQGPVCCHTRGCAELWEQHLAPPHPSLPRLPDRAFIHRHSLLFNLLLIPGKNPVIWAAPWTGIIFQRGSWLGAASQQWESLLCSTTLPLHEELIYEYEAPLAPGEQLQPPGTPEHSALLPKAQLHTSSALILCMHFIMSLGQKLS